MRFKKSNCRKKTVFSQPDVMQLVAVVVCYYQNMTNIDKILNLRIKFF